MESGIPEKEEKHGRCMGPAGGAGKGTDRWQEPPPGYSAPGHLSRDRCEHTVAICQHAQVLGQCWANLEWQAVEAHRGVALGDLLTIPQQNREGGDG